MEMLAGTTKVYITDNSGNKFFNTLCGEDYAMSEVRNLNKKLDQARKYPEQFKFLDVETAKVVTEGKCGDYFSQIDFNMSDDELLAALGV